MHRWIEKSLDKSFGSEPETFSDKQIEQKGRKKRGKKLRKLKPEFVEAFR